MVLTPGRDFTEEVTEWGYVAEEWLDWEHLGLPCGGGVFFLLFHIGQKPIALSLWLSHEKADVDNALAREVLLIAEAKIIDAANE